MPESRTSWVKLSTDIFPNRGTVIAPNALDGEVDGFPPGGRWSYQPYPVPFANPLLQKTEGKVLHRAAKLLVRK
jgi:hypothetical protein